MKYFIKYFTLLTVLMFLSVSCHKHNDIMNQPIAFGTASEFMRQLQQLEKTLDKENYQRLTDAIGNLKATDIKNVSVADFYQTLNGLSPNNIIKKSQAQKIIPKSQFE